MYEKHDEEVYSTTHDSVLDEDERDIYITNEAESIICSKKVICLLILCDIPYFYAVLCLIFYPDSIYNYL